MFGYLVAEQVEVLAMNNTAGYETWHCVQQIGRGWRGGEGTGEGEGEKGE